MRTAVQWWIAAGVALPIAGAVVLPSLVGGAWSPTPMRIVRKSLLLARPRPGEVLYDLGAGDGRVVVHAASHYPIQCVAVEVDPLKTALISARLRLKGLSDRVRIERTNFFHLDLTQAGIVFAYLSPAAMERLKEKFERELPPGARVVSYRREIPGWTPARIEDGIYVYERP